MSCRPPVFKRDLVVLVEVGVPEDLPDAGVDLLEHDAHEELHLRESEAMLTSRSPSTEIAVRCAIGGRT